MSKIEITVSVDEEKFKPVEAYLKKKGLSFDDEINKAVDALYSKVVPTAVKEYKSSLYSLFLSVRRNLLWLKNLHSLKVLQLVL